MPLHDLYDTSQGFIVNDIYVIEAEIAVYKATDQYLYNSKRATSYVGLKNQGATCYMNSLLQMLFHIPYFRKVVYHMPTSLNDEPSSSIPMALQSLFYKLQHNESSVATKDLTRSFGWDTHDAFLQHDVHEFNKVLCEKLEEKMKRTIVEGAIQRLFEGHHKNYVECINVDYKSSIQESFYDLQLDVKGCHDVYTSFDKYVAVEHLDGVNIYHAGQYGLQNAKKGVLFTDFPPVLQLHLKRFEYEFVGDDMVKERLKREQKEKEIKKKAKAEADMYMIVKVATDEDFARQIGNDICFGLVDHTKVRSFRVQKLKPFHTFKDLRAGPLPDKKSDDILLFFKLYEPEKGELRYAGRLFVKSYDKPADILQKLNKLAGYAPNE
ncbi:UNVERIFIED_CONTAM: Ubiquitin carboxyl-terminal hydrolase 12 [Sesamum calycinum]|uniref:Ubiquitin carboxyl-terminal hydrolase 12 n=1 Tax=Sesamum calycinum TaxID=2727403 RepID=A0AAW2QM39_9LAMI